MTWVKAASLTELDSKPKVIKRPPRQICVFKVGPRVFAIDNRCPHEGYPLSDGSVNDSCVLTCNWHNWKFRLEDGECVLGGDHVRRYPSRLEDGFAWVEITDPPADEIRHEILRGLKTAFDDRDFGRICREIARLHFNGMDCLDAIRKAIGWAHTRLEFGTRHSMAAAADWLRLADELGDDLEGRLVCLAEAVDHFAWDALRHREYPYPSAGEPFKASDWVAAVEAEHRVPAEAMVVGGLTDGLHWTDMEEAFATAALAHYNSFGHSLIYVSKVGTLINRLGTDIEPYVLPPLAREIVYATREDLIPEFRGYQSALAGLGDFGTLGGTPCLSPAFPMSTTRALKWVHEQMSHHTPLEIYDALLHGLAKNMIYFDTRYGQLYDRPVSENVSWLDVTHGITFSNAVRVTCGRYPEMWPKGLLQMACFLGRNSGFLDTSVAASEWSVTNPQAFFGQTIEKLKDHGMRDPIFSAHLLKTSVAVRDELEHVCAETGQALLQGLNRFLNSPIKTKHVRRLARQAIDLVARDFERAQQDRP
jgi:nitrite reductase/ring-hydroxylating ferredoxin subunit